jgi:hypothetical protein
MALELAAAVAFSLQVVLVGQLGHRVPAIALGAWQLLVLAAVLGVAVPFTGGLSLPTGAVLLDVVFCGMAASAFAFAVQAAAQQHVSSSTAALIMAIEPGIAMVGGAVAGIQALTPLALLGLLLLSSGSAAYGGTRVLALARRFLSPLQRLPRPTRSHPYPLSANGRPGQSQEEHELASALGPFQSFEHQDQIFWMDRLSRPSQRLGAPPAMLLDDSALGRGPAGRVHLEDGAAHQEELLILRVELTLKLVLDVTAQDDRARLVHLESGFFAHLPESGGSRRLAILDAAPRGEPPGTGLGSGRIPTPKEQHSPQIVDEEDARRSPSSDLHEGRALTPPPG